MKALCYCLAVLTVMIYLMSATQALNALDTKETARQLATEANDNALRPEECREALRKLEEAKNLFLSVGETEEAARAFNRMGRLQLLLNTPNDALNSHHQALTLIQPAHNPEVEVDSLNGLGSAYLVFTGYESR